MINIAELLKNCPKGTKLYSPLFGECKLERVEDEMFIHVKARYLHDFKFDEYGQLPDLPIGANINGECLLFPSRDCRTWEGWNPPIEPKFKVGDWITDGACKVKITDINNTYYWYSKNCILGEIESIDKKYHLWTIQDVKDGDVLANDAGCIFINTGFEKDDKVTLDCYCYVSVQGIFYEEDHKTGSWLYVSHIHPATKEQCDLLFKKMKEAGYTWDDEKKELKKKHYDISNFHAGMPVLVRDIEWEKWCYALYSHYNSGERYPLVTAGNNSFIQCIPFEGNEHLLGTTDIPSEEYINW